MFDVDIVSEPSFQFAPKLFHAERLVPICQGMHDLFHGTAQVPQSGGGKWLLRGKGQPQNHD